MLRELSHHPPHLLAMNAQKLRARAQHYRRVAGLVSDEAMAEALIELAVEYESLADRMKDEPTPRAAQQSSQQCPPHQ
jgi:hypothetical protein